MLGLRRDSIIAVIDYPFFKEAPIRGRPVLAKIGTAFENAISDRLHFQPLSATEHGGASCLAANAELIGVSLMRVDE
jgi:hypothetical protein